MSSPTVFPDDDSNAESLIDAAIGRIVRGVSVGEFSEWFAAQTSSLEEVHDVQADTRRPALAMARALWAAVPVPSNRWRARPLPKTERNDPCYCGSGRKYKQCCAEFSHLQFPLGEADLTGLVISKVAPQDLTVASLRQLPPNALAQAAFHWNQQGRADMTAEVFTPLFEQTKDLDERYEPALDAVLDALGETGRETRRYDLIAHMAKGRDKSLATTARCRLVTMLADRGDFDQAWVVFKEAQRAGAGDPQLWHLELTVLISEGRQDEARLRAPVLAAQARRAGFPDLADMLLALGEHGMQAVYQDQPDEDDDYLDDDEAAWLDLCAQIPAELDASACLALYTVSRQSPPDAMGPSSATTDETDDYADDPIQALRAGKTWLHVRAKPKLSSLEKRWQRRFPVGKPMLSSLMGDAASVCEDPGAVGDFLRDNPQAWLSVEVVDDLLLAAAEYCDWDSPLVLLQGSWRLAEHGLRLLHALWGDARDADTAAAAKLGAQWADLDTRPLLRILAQAIELARMTHRDDEAMSLARWAMALNPTDNHGWRVMLVDDDLEHSRFEQALSVLDRYPGDFPPADHNRALALFGLGRREEAQGVLAAAHQEYPIVLKMLLPDICDAPEVEPGPGMRVGGAEVAFEYRVQSRPIWVRTGALAWARQWALPDPVAEVPKEAPRKVPAKAPKRGAAGHGPANSQAAQSPSPPASSMALPVEALAVVPERLMPKALTLLRTHFDFDRLHGFLTAIAWAPEMVMPGKLVGGAMQMLKPERSALLDGANSINKVLQPLMELYNDLNTRVLQTPLLDGAPTPFDAPEVSLSATGDDATRVFVWAAGFVQGSESSSAAWRALGRKVSARAAKGGVDSFPALYALAARAPHWPDGSDNVINDGPDGWRVRGDEGQILLDGVPSVNESPAQTLALALNDLWKVMAPVRQARMARG
ncbi:MAG: UPF0149 family protein [Rhodoferax sp.]|nr:UPF0149 family protein [Rhodoferax sp.]